jgi:enolase
MTAKFRDLEIYSFISELCQSEPIIPLPITTVLARGIGSPEEKEYQYFHLYPLASSSLSSAMEILTEFSHRLQRIVAGKQFFDTEAKIEQLPPTNIPSPETLESIEHSIEVSHLWNGCISVRGMSLTRCLKVTLLP